MKKRLHRFITLSVEVFIASVLFFGWVIACIAANILFNN